MLRVFNTTGVCKPEYVGKGYGKQVLLLLMEYCSSLGGKSFIYSTRKGCHFV